MHILSSGLGFGVSIPGPNKSNLARAGSSLTVSISYVGAHSKSQPFRFWNLMGLIHSLKTWALVSLLEDHFSNLAHSKNEFSHSYVGKHYKGNNHEKIDF